MAGRGVIAVTITSDDNTKPGLTSAEANFKGFGQRISGLAVGFGAAVGTAVANVASNVVSGIGTFVSGSIDQASDLSESLNAVNTVFGDSAAAIQAWGESNANQFGLTRSAFFQMSAPLGAMLKNAGVSMDGVTDSTLALTERAADMASIFNTDVDQALAAISAGLRGEADPLEQYGVRLNAAAVEAEALAATGKETAAALTEEELALARVNLILKQTDDLAGDFTRTSGEYANAQKISAARTAELQAEIGTKLMPIMQKLTEWKLALVSVIADKVIPALEDLSVWFRDHVLPAMRDLIAWAEQNWPKFQMAIETVVAWFRDNAWPVIQQVLGFMQAEFDKLVGWVRENWPEIKETIDGVIGAVKVIIENVTAQIKAIWDRWGNEILTGLRLVWDNIKGTVDAAITTIRGIINTVTALIRGDWQGVWDGIKTIVEGVWKGIRQIVETAVGALGLLLSAAWQGIKGVAADTWESITSTITGAIGGIVELVTGLPARILSIGQAMYDAGKSIISRLVSGFKAAWNSLLGGRELLPSFGVGPIKTPSVLIPTLHTGGIVPGTPGQEVLALLEAGEKVIPRNAAGPPAAGGVTLQLGDMNVNVALSGIQHPSDARKLADQLGPEIYRVLVRQVERHGGGGGLKRAMGLSVKA